MLIDNVSRSQMSTPIESDAALQAMFHRHFSIELVSSPRQLDEVMSLRYQVYCCEHTFEDAESFPEGREHDAYDERSVHALVRHRQSGQCTASVRLVLADVADSAAPFPVEAHCSQALPADGMAIIDKTPRMRVAEISRLAVSHDVQKRMTRNGPCDEAPDQQALPYIVVGLFAAIVQWSAKLSVTHWLAVMEPACLRLLRRYGIRFCHVGGTVDYHGRRKPAVARARTLVDGIKAARPDVWHLITASGCILPNKAPMDRMHKKEPVIATAEPSCDPHWPVMPTGNMPPAIARPS